MKRTLIIWALGFATIAAAQNITPTEKDKAAHYLTDTRNGLMEAVKGLSEAQWQFKPTPDRWSIAEVLEHVTVLEDFFVNTLRPQLLQAPAGTPGTDVRNVDAMILAKVPDRSTKAQSPDSIAPTGRWTPQASLDRFLADRRETANFLTSTANLR